MEQDKELVQIARRRTIELMIKFVLALVILGLGISGISYYANRYVVNAFPKNLQLTQGQLNILGLGQVMYETSILNRNPSPGVQLSAENGLVIGTSENCNESGSTPEFLLCSYHSAHYSNQATTWTEIFRGTISARNKETQTDEWPGASDDQSLFLYFYHTRDKADDFDRFFQSECRKNGNMGKYHVYEDREFGILSQTSYLPARTTRPEVYAENSANFEMLAEGILDTHADTIRLEKVTCSDFS